MRHDGDSRIVDANGNRVREGLRILDDLARFVLDDAALAAEFKALRHAVTAALGGPGTSALAARDVEGDVGTTTTGAGEATRPDIASVAEAAGGRVAEGLRALEEMTKLAGRAEATAGEPTPCCAQWRGGGHAWGCQPGVGAVGGIACKSRPSTSPYT